MMPVMKNLYNALLEPVLDAGRAILDVRDQGFAVTTKSDQSPVTVADQRAEAILLEAIAHISPNMPVVAEEEASEGRIPDVKDKSFFLIDPLDGTKEFINGGTDFTVNIAVINDSRPIFGVIYVPMADTLYVGGFGEASRVMGFATGDPVEERIHVRKADQSNPSIIASKNHMNDETRAFMAQYDSAEVVPAGSSVKFCRIAEGAADIYPRFGPTMEWDTAAGQAVLEAAGGRVLNPDGTAFQYRKPDFINGHFIALGDPRLHLPRMG